MWRRQKSKHGDTSPEDNKSRSTDGNNTVSYSKMNDLSRDTQSTSYEEGESRKRASSNYFDIDTNRHTDHSLAVSLGIINGNHNNDSQDDAVLDSVFEQLALKFGFQRGSVENQKEHLMLLLSNYRVRYLSKSAQSADSYIMALHDKLFENYRGWCTFLLTKPLFKTNCPQMDMALYFLIWGESANLRHMPECICFLYHKMMEAVTSDAEAGSKLTAEHGDFLRNLVKPIWEQCQKMQQKSTLGRQIEHTKVRNYDDLNEFFWDAQCLSCNLKDIGKSLEKNARKTFMEKRSIFTLILNYYRIFHFNLMFFITLSVLAFASTVSTNSGQGGLKQFKTLGSTVTPFKSQDLVCAAVSLPLAHAFLCAFKCLLEFWSSWRIMGKRLNYLLSLSSRLIWNGVFTACFAMMLLTPDASFASSRLLDLFPWILACFIIPGLCILGLQVTAPTTLLSTWAIKFIRGGESCYVGKSMSPPVSYIVQYVVFWIVLWTVKAIVSYTLLIGPLMLPSISIYSMNFTASNTLFYVHNLDIILALWLPVFFVFMYDTQIYFTILQAVLGAVKGFINRSGEVHGFVQLTKSFRIAPLLFDQKVVTRLARSIDGYQESPFHSQMMLRFVVIWNEIVNSFRQGDLIDDKEAAILQYDIQDTGEVYEPVFLSAGKLSEAFQLITKLKKQGKGDSELRIRIVEDNCLSAIKSFYTAAIVVLDAIFSDVDSDILEAIMDVHKVALHGKFMANFQVQYIHQLKATMEDFFEAILDLSDPFVQHSFLDVKVHSPRVVRNFVSKVETLLNDLQIFTRHPVLIAKLSESHFTNPANDYKNACLSLSSIMRNEIAMSAVTRAYLLLSLEKQEAMPRCSEARRRLGFFMKSLSMDIPQLRSIREMHSFSVITPYYKETVLFSMEELNNPLVNHPIFKKLEEDGKNITILKYLTTCHPHEWENFLERMDVSTAEEALISCPQDVRLWASNRGQTLARTVQGMMLYEDAIKILHWLEIGSNTQKTPSEKQKQLSDMVRLKFSFICGCQVYGSHRVQGKQQARDIDFLLRNYSNFRVAYVDMKQIIDPKNDKEFVNTYDAVLIKSEKGDIVEVYRYELPGDPILGEGKPENQNIAIQFTRGEFLQTIDMNQEHYFEETLKMPQLLETADLHPSGKPVSIIGMREHIFTGNASSLAKFKTWQELVFVTLSQRVLADPLYCRMHYGHPDVFDKILAITRGGVSKASKGINLSEDVFAGFNTSLRGGVITHVEFMQCGKGRDVALSQISMFEAKLANGSGETSLSRDIGRIGQFMDFFRLNSTFYSHTGFYFATWLTIVTTFVYMYSKMYITLTGVERDIIFQMSHTEFVRSTPGFEQHAFDDLSAVINTQYLIQAGLFLTLPLIVVYFTEMGIFRGILHFIEMIATLGPAFFVFQVGTTSHYFDNNLLHGGGKYEATGRGFKITRESFVLLYRAYANSHYKKAFELIGLCFIYLTFGDFNICFKQSEDNFGNKFCSASQGYGAQTFAVWFIAILWLLSPFFFNTDGLDWEKTKIDIVSWTHWMFMDKTYKDEDEIISGGWITWWSSELECIQGSSLSSRVAVVLRESRHFFLFGYVITLRFKSLYTVVGTLAAVLATVLILWILGYIGIGFKRVSPRIRASIYALILFSVTITYFVVGSVIFGLNQQSSLALFFGYFSALYGFSEILRVFNFASFPITLSVAYQQLAFFFDFCFGLALLLPLLIMSGIPFMNVIQTRMMYNEGFSKVMSASNQYAFSLCAFTGILGGVSCGWLFYLLNSLSISAEFVNYTETLYFSFDSITEAFAYLVPFSASFGALCSGPIGHFIGRRWPIVFGGITSLVSLVVLSAVQSTVENSATSHREMILYYGVILLSAAVGMFIAGTVVYNYEISTKEFRGKSVLLLGVGVSVGGAIGANLTATEGCGWLWQVFWASIIVGLVTPVINGFPESPTWVLGKYGISGCELSLTILRRKQAVSEELAELKAEYTSSSFFSSISLLKLILISTLQIVFAFASVSAYRYHIVLFYTNAGASTIPSTILILQSVGAFLAFFFIDRVGRKATIVTALIPIAVCAIAYAGNTYFTFWNGLHYSTIVGLSLGFFVGIGLVSSVWIAAVELFNPRQRSAYVGFSMAAYFIAPGLSTFFEERVIMLLFAALSIASCLGFLVSFTSNQTGAICLPREVKPSVEVPNTPGSARTKIFRSRTKSTGYSIYESPTSLA